jgi:Fe-S cluster assembly protein SufD
MVQAVVNMKASDPYLARFEDTFEREGVSRGPAWLYPIRKAGIARFAEIGLPTVQQEDWRFTNVAPIGRLPFKPLLAPSEVNIKLDQFHFTSLPSSRLVFVNGHYSERLSSILPQEAGVQIGSLAAAMANDGALLQKHLARFAKADENGFSALNTAFFTDGAFIYVPTGKVVREPVHLLFVSTAAEAGAAIHPRNLEIAERDSKLTLI